MENKRNKEWDNGFSATEFLTVIVVATVLLAIVLTIAFDVHEKEKYRVMKYNATLLGYNASASLMSNQNKEKYYLQDLIGDKLFVNIKNPFGGAKYCDTYNTFVELKDNKKYVTLKCGSYLIEHQDITKDDFTIYKVSSWQLKKLKGTNVEKQILYNYRINKKEVLNESYPEDAFLIIFNQNFQTSYDKVSKIPKKYNIVKNTYYRTKVVVNER